MTQDLQSLFTLDRALTPAERKKLRGRYQPKGYAALPGTGPEGETCGSCRHKVTQDWTAGRYIKCELLRAHWTRGPGTDIRARSPACKRWETIDE